MATSALLLVRTQSLVLSQFSRSNQLILPQAQLQLLNKTTDK
jgi:hypothetical protein